MQREHVSNAQVVRTHLQLPTRRGMYRSTLIPRSHDQANVEQTSSKIQNTRARRVL